jgi:hypothetical protein
VVDTRIWGYERAYARSYPQIRPLSTATPNEPEFIASTGYPKKGMRRTRMPNTHTFFDIA